MKNNYIATIKNLGLSTHEAAVYLASLSLGPASAMQIADTAEIKRTTAYPVIRSLEAKGLMRVELAGSKRKFAAERPDRLESALDERRRAFADILPELSALYNLRAEQGAIGYRKGLAGIKATYEALLEETSPGAEYLIISDEDQWVALDERYFTDFLRRRAKLDFRVRTLLVDSSLARERKKFEKNFNQDIRLLPKGVRLATNLVVTPSQAVIHQLTPPVSAVLIRNPNTIEMFRSCFEVMWRSVGGEESHESKTL